MDYVDLFSYKIGIGICMYFNYSESFFHFLKSLLHFIKTLDSTLCCLIGMMIILEFRKLRPPLIKKLNLLAILKSFISVFVLCMRSDC